VPFAQSILKTHDADWVPLPYDVLKAISTRIVNEVRGINRVVYDITSKPPGQLSGIARPQVVEPDLYLVRFGDKLPRRISPYDP